MFQFEDGGLSKGTDVSDAAVWLESTGLTWSWTQGTTITSDATANLTMSIRAEYSKYAHLTSFTIRF